MGGVLRAAGAARRRARRAAPAAAARGDAPRHLDLSGTVDFDHGPLLAAIGHVDALQRKLQGLRAVAGVEIHHRHKHEGEGSIPGAVRNALNGNFGSDGRAFS